MKIFVTGGSGFVGQNLVKRLVSEKHQVFALSRSGKSARILNSLGANVIDGHLGNVNDWDDVLENVEVVVHCASPVEFWGTKERFTKEIIKPTQELYAACDRYNVKKFIYLSSESVLQNNIPLVQIDEATLLDVEPNSVYGWAKKEAESWLLQNKKKTKLIILRPPFVWGKACPAIQKIINDSRAKKFPWIGNGKSQFESIHVENLVEGVCAALHKGENGEVYYLTDGHNLTVKEFFSPILQRLGAPQPKKNLPTFLALFLASCVEMMWKTFKLPKKPPVTRFEISFLALPRRYIVTKAQKELGYAPIISVTDGLKAL